MELIELANLIYLDSFRVEKTFEQDIPVVHDTAIITKLRLVDISNRCEMLWERLGE